MSSPRSIGGSVREGTRVVLREITASLHNSPPMQPSRCKSGNDTSVVKTGEHEVKVRFAREFADVGSISYSAPESLSSASSFQSLSSSLSAKSSSGICPDSVPLSPNQAANNSYANTSIPGVEDLILGCADIQLEDDADQSFNPLHSTQDLSQDQTFASATDEPIDDRIDDRIDDLTKDDIASDVSPVDSRNVTQILDNEKLSKSRENAYSLNCTEDFRDRPIFVVPSSNSSAVKTAEAIERSVSSNSSNDLISDVETFNFTVSNSVDETPLPHHNTGESNLNSTVCLSADEAASADVSESKERIALENEATEADPPLTFNFVPCSSANSVTSVSVLAEYAEEPSLPSISSISSLIAVDSTKFCENDSQQVEENVKSLLLTRSSSPFSDSNIAVTSSTQSVLTSPDQEIGDKSDSLTETVPPSLYNAINSGESCASLLNDTAVLGSKTPQVEEDSTTSIRTESDRDNTAASNIELSPTEVDSLEVNVSPLAEKEEENNKSDGRLDAKGENIVEETGALSSAKEEDNQEREEESTDEKLDTTLTFQDVSINSEAVSEVDLYTEFKPPRQSTTLALPAIDQPNFDEFKSAAEQVANDIFKSSLEFSDESDRFISATSEIFQDPTSFDFLIAHGNSKTINRLRTESLYVKFDPLVSDTSMLPQGNTQPMNEEQNGKTDSPPPNIGTPKRNPAIAAIDRLLFYSPISTSMTQKTEEPQEKIEQATEESKSDTPVISDVNMSKELELVRATVLQLEEELEKQKKEYEVELERQKNSFQEKINKLQAQIAQEVKSKSQMTVVVEEYEKSISRLLTERERDRTNFEQEKAKVQEELQATNVHLTNTEAAFNDVHQKYEKLKGVVSVYKNNEAVLKESIQENMETIKGLEARYEQLKNHAMAQLEKANFDLDAIRKQHEDETVKLHAMVRKAELKSNSLAELVEQKTKENKELTQILDEVIARVGHQNAE